MADPTNVPEITGEPEKSDNAAQHPDSESDLENDSDKDTESSTYRKDLPQSSSTFSVTDWQAVWDDSAQSYYYWNTVTNETSWTDPSGGSTDTYYDPTLYSAYPQDYTTSYEENDDTSSNPLDSLLDKIDTEVKPKFDGTSSSALHVHSSPFVSSYANHNADSGAHSSYASQDTEIKATAFFDPRTNKFRSNSDVAKRNPEHLSAENRAMRQMNYYFDYDQYSEQRNQERSVGGGKARLSKREVAALKERREQKKQERKRKWLIGDN